MSVLTPTLYGNRLFGRETYSENQDPQTFNLSFNESIASTDVIADSLTKPLIDSLSFLDAYITMMQLVKTDTMTLADAKTIAATKALSDSLTPADATVIYFTKTLADTVALSDLRFINMTKVLSDSMTLSEVFQIAFGRSFAETVTLADSLAKTARLSEAEVMALSDTMSLTMRKVLAETVTLTDVKFFNMSKVLSDFMSALDTVVQVSMVKSLNDILLVQDWISIRLEQPQIWTVQTTATLPYSTLYGRVLFGSSLYSGLSGTTWISVKPTIPNVNGWKSFNQLEEQN